MITHANHPLTLTLQSKMALVLSGLALATDLPTFTGWSRPSIRSWKGWELGRQMSEARATPPPPPGGASAGMLRSSVSQ